MPVLNPITNQQTNSGATLTFTAIASDADLPANTLTILLGTGAPAGAVIDPITGVFTWLAATNWHDTSYTVRVIVTDNCDPALSSYQDVSVLVIGADDFTAWRRSKFGDDVDDPAKEATVWGNLADPDHDGTANIIEFMTVREPMVADPELGPQFRLEGGEAIMTYRETKLTDHDILMFGTMSADLNSWLYAGLKFVEVADGGDHYLMEIRTPVNRQRKLFMRLEAFQF